ncbi:MAG: hypothetical protein GY906_18245, partial [bacterium]|nr:hypothetical protein [bacterium]
PDFDSGISGWTAAANGAIIWDEFTDIDGDSESGSMVLTQLAGSTTAGIAMADCVSVVPNVNFSFGGNFLIDSGQGGVSRVLVGLTLFDGPSCSGSPLTSPSTTNSAIEDVWFEKIMTWVMPGNALSASLRVNAFNGDATKFVIRADAFHVGEVPIFADGFESGDTSAWSSVMP